MNANEAAFLDVISHAEGTDRATEPYRTCFGFSHVIIDLSDHPTVTGEWMGASYAGGLSTAAGRYQINRPSWLEYRTLLKLPDFSPASQDAWCLRKLSGIGALPLIEAGLIDQAIALCSRTWASLPGSPSGQPEKKLADLLDFYTLSGGAKA